MQLIAKWQIGDIENEVNSVLLTRQKNSFGVSFVVFSLCVLLLAT